LSTGASVFGKFEHQEINSDFTTFIEDRTQKNIGEAGHVYCTCSRIGGLDDKR